MVFPIELMAMTATDIEDIKHIKSFRLCTTTTAELALPNLFHEILLFPTAASYQRALAIGQHPRHNSLVKTLVILPSLLSDTFMSRDLYRLELLRQAGHSDTAAAALLASYQQATPPPELSTLSTTEEPPSQGETINRIYAAYSAFYTEQQNLQLDPMPLLNGLLTLLPNLASLRVGSIADLIFPTNPSPLPGSPIDLVAKIHFPIKSPLPPLSALFFNPMDVIVPKLLGHLTTTNKHIKRFHNFCTTPSLTLARLDRAIVHAEFLELRVEWPISSSPGYVPLATATGLTSLVLRFERKMAGRVVDGEMGQVFGGTWPVLRSLVLTGAMVKGGLVRRWFERHVGTLRSLELGAWRWARKPCMPWIAILIHWRRAPGEVEEVGRRVLRFLRGEVWRGVSLGEWLELEEVDEDGEGEEDEDEDNNGEDEDNNGEDDQDGADDYDGDNDDVVDDDEDGEEKGGEGGDRGEEKGFETGVLS